MSAPGKRWKGALKAHNAEFQRQPGLQPSFRSASRNSGRNNHSVSLAGRGFAFLS